MNDVSPDPIRASISPRVRYAGAFVGVLAACGLVLLLPLSLQTLGVPVSIAWGLGKLAAPLCLVGAIPGCIFAPRFVHLGKSFELIG
jgi:hypothetical protein